MPLRASVRENSVNCQVRFRRCLAGPADFWPELWSKEKNHFYWTPVNLFENELGRERESLESFRVSFVDWVDILPAKELAEIASLSVEGSEL